MNPISLILPVLVVILSVILIIRALIILGDTIADMVERPFLPGCLPVVRKVVAAVLAVMLVVVGGLLVRFLINLVW